MFLLGCCAAAGCSSLARRGAERDTLAARQLALRGTAAMQRGNSADAELLLRQAVESCPLDERVRFQYAESLWALGRMPEAVIHMEQAVRLSGGDAGWLVRLGEMYLALGRMDEAATSAAKALQSNRQLAAAWALQGDVQCHRGDSLAGLASYHRALSYQEHYPSVQLAIADIYRAAGRSDRELATLRSLAEGYPAGETPRDVIARQGLCLKQLGRYEAAIQLLAAAVGAGEPGAELLFQLAETQCLAGDSANARLTLQRALSEDPGHAASRSLQSQLVARQQQLGRGDYRL